MNTVYVSVTPENTVKYPLHRHETWEIMYYLHGTGMLASAAGDIPFSPGTAVIVPPQILHGSVSETGFRNVSIGGDFQNRFIFDRPVRIQDNMEKEGETLVRLILQNRNPPYRNALCSAFCHFLLQNVNQGTPIRRTLGDLIDQICNRFTDPEFRIAPLLEQSGYTRDYLRTEFKAVTSKTPIQFLNDLRIEHAKRLFEIYGGNLSVAETARSCGFFDQAYFARLFRRKTGVSPAQYRATGEQNDK